MGHYPGSVREVEGHAPNSRHVVVCRVVQIYFLPHDGVIVITVLLRNRRGLCCRRYVTLRYVTIRFTDVTNEQPCCCWHYADDSTSSRRYEST
jgi:hypothetical protein